MSEKDRDPHRDWLDLLDTDGPFLSVPALKKAWPTGMPAPDRAALDALRDAKPAFEKAWDAWDMADKDDAGARWRRTGRRGTPGWTSSCARSSAGRTSTSPPHRPMSRSTRPTTPSPSARPAR